MSGVAADVTEGEGDTAQGDLLHHLVGVIRLCPGMQLEALAGAAALVQERHPMTAPNLPALFSKGRPYPTAPSGFAATPEGAIATMPDGAPYNLGGWMGEWVSTG